MTAKGDVVDGREALIGVLSRSEAKLSLGHYGDAISELEGGCKENPRLSQVEGWAAQVLAQEARIRFHMHEENTAFECVQKIGPQIRIHNASVDAQCWSLSGLVARRKSLSARKSGALDLAIKEAQSANKCFSEAMYAAKAASDHSFEISNHQNYVYTLGLISAISNSSKFHNPRLTASSVALERELLHKCAPAFYNPLPGATMIVDLAIGADLSPHEVMTLQEGQELGNFTHSYANAGRSVIGERYVNWVEFLLDRLAGSVNFSGGAHFVARPWQVSQVLVLAAKLIQRNDNDTQRVLAMRLLSYFELARRAYSFPPQLQTPLNDAMHLVMQFCGLTQGRIRALG